MAGLPSWPSQFLNEAEDWFLSLDKPITVSSLYPVCVRLQQLSWDACEYLGADIFGTYLCNLRTTGIFIAIETGMIKERKLFFKFSIMASQRLIRKLPLLN